VVTATLLDGKAVAAQIKTELTARVTALGTLGIRHGLGGIAGESVKETTDEDPVRVALVADAVSAYLLDILGVDATLWRAGRRPGVVARFSPGVSPRRHADYSSPEP
jgi:hypothetical protein